MFFAITTPAVAGDHTSTRNLALGRPYTLSIPPNYPTAMHGTDRVLTDGKHAAGAFWRNGEILGWSWHTAVAISVPLGQPAEVTRVVVGAGARRKGDAFFPSYIAAYGGVDASKLSYLGSSKVSLDEESPIESTYRTIDITVPPIAIEYLTIVVFSRGAFLWLGEVEAHGRGPTTPIKSSFSGTMASSAVMADAVARRRVAITNLPGEVPVGPDSSRRWAMPLPERHYSLRMKGEQGCAIDRIEPWPDNRTDDVQVKREAPLRALVGGRDYLAYRIRNLSEVNAIVRTDAKASDSTALRWFALSHVRALNTEWVADVVAPFSTTTLPPNSSMVVLAEVSPALAGHDIVDLTVTCGENTETQSITLATTSPISMSPILHGTQWAYLHMPEQAVVRSAIACDPDLLERHGMDTMVVHPDALLSAETQNSWQLLRRYFQTFQRAQRVLLWMDVRSRAWPFLAMSSDDNAVSWLQSWWADVTMIARDASIQGELIIYPIDEPRESDIELLLRTRDLLTKAGVKARIYTTADDGMADRLPSLDIVQVHNPKKSRYSQNVKQEIHGYYTAGDGRLLSPSSYYRRQGWEAFAEGLAGIGVWALWDTTGLADQESGWDPFTGYRERDFGLIYRGENGCGWPSRRLLAWRRGMEEHHLLMACATDEQRRTVAKAMRNDPSSGSAIELRAMLDNVMAQCAR
jgi:hypothetical protein